MHSNRETNSDLNYSQESQESINKEEQTQRKRVLFRHRLSERKVPEFLRKSRNSVKRIESEIEETKNKIIKNLESIKIFDKKTKKLSNKYLKLYEKEENNDTFNIYKYIDERKNIKEKLLLYYNNLDSDVLRLIEYLSLDPFKRTKFEQKYIKNYLMKTSLMQSLLNLNEDKKNFTKIINKICLNLKYKFLYAGKTIYEINSIPDNYYYIIEGKVQAYKPEKIFMRMNGFEFFTYIMRLKRDNENYLIDLILKNQTHFIINKSDLSILNYIFFIIIFKEFCINVNFRFFFNYELEKNKNYASPLHKMIDLCFCDKDELLKDINFNDKSPMKALEKQLKKNMPLISDDLLKYYTPMAVDKKLYDTTLFKYKAIVDLKKGSFFGESSNKKHSVREYTLKTIEDCHLSYLGIEIYDSFLKNEKEKITTQMIDYLYKNFFFNQISESEFKNQFFESFVFEVKGFGHKLAEQNKKVDYIYFINEGEISVSCALSINLFIDDILKPLKENNTFKYNEQFIKLIKELQNFLKNNKIDFNSLNDTYLFIAISRSIIGLDSYFFGLNNYIYDATVTSSIVKYFKIEKKYLLRIFREYYFIKEIAKNEAYQKILLIIDRFIKTLKLKLIQRNNSILSTKNINSNKIKVKINKENTLKVNNNFNKYNIIKIEDNNNNDYYKNNISLMNNKKNINKLNNKKSEKNLLEKENIFESLNNDNISLFERKKSIKNNIKKSFNSIISNKKIKNFNNLIDFSNLNIIKSKLKKASIKTETILVNKLQNNIAKNLLFSRPKIKKVLSHNNILDNNLLSKLKIKLKPLKIIKPNFNTQEPSFNITEKNSKSNSIIKTYRSVKSNTIDFNENNENTYIQDNEEKIISVKSIMNIKNDNIDNITYLSNNSITPINKKIFKIDDNNKIEEKVFSNDIINSCKNINKLFKSFSSRNYILKRNLKRKTIDIKKKLNNQFLIQKNKKIKYKILKKKILQENYWSQ